MRANASLVACAFLFGDGVPDKDIKAMSVMQGGVNHADAVTPDMIRSAITIINGRKVLARTGRLEKLPQSVVDTWKPELIIKTPTESLPAEEVVPPIKEL